MNNNELLEQIAGLCRLDMSAEWRAARILDLLTGGDDDTTAGGTYTVEILSGNVYRVTIPAATAAQAADIAQDIDLVAGCCGEHDCPITVETLDTDRVVRHIGKVGA